MQVNKAKIKQKWLKTQLGKALLKQECLLLENALDGVFGEHFLQLGLWGDVNTFKNFTRTQYCSIVSEYDSFQSGFEKPSIISNLYQLPVESNSIDAILLPHSLDYCDQPHAILREVDRVLRRDGKLIILGFRPGGLWGLRRLLPGAGIPPAANYLISERRMKDWLQLLDMRIESALRYFFRLPFQSNNAKDNSKWEMRGQSWWPELSACYMLSAQKRVSTFTSVRPLWRRQPRVVTGMIKSQRQLPKIRFERNKN